MSASGGLCPLEPLPGLRSRIALEDFRPQTPSLVESKNILSLNYTMQLTVGFTLRTFNSCGITGLGGGMRSTECQF